MKDLRDDEGKPLQINMPPRLVTQGHDNSISVRGLMDCRPEYLANTFQSQLIDAAPFQFCKKRIVVQQSAAANEKQTEPSSKAVQQPLAPVAQADSKPTTETSKAEVKSSSLLGNNQPDSTRKPGIFGLSNINEPDKGNLFGKTNGSQANPLFSANISKPEDKSLKLMEGGSATNKPADLKKPSDTPSLSQGLGIRRETSKSALPAMETDKQIGKPEKKNEKEPEKKSGPKSVTEIFEALKADPQAKKFRESPLLATLEKTLFSMNILVNKRPNSKFATMKLPSLELPTKPVNIEDLRSKAEEINKANKRWQRIKKLCQATSERNCSAQTNKILTEVESIDWNSRNVYKRLKNTRELFNNSEANLRNFISCARSFMNYYYPPVSRDLPTAVTDNHSKNSTRKPAAKLPLDGSNIFGLKLLRDDKGKLTSSNTTSPIGGLFSSGYTTLSHNYPKGNTNIELSKESSLRPTKVVKNSSNLFSSQALKPSQPDIVSFFNSYQQAKQEEIAFLMRKLERGDMFDNSKSLCFDFNNIEEENSDDDISFSSGSQSTQLCRSDLTSDFLELPKLINLNVKIRHSMDYNLRKTLSELASKWEAQQLKIADEPKTPKPTTQPAAKTSTQANFASKAANSELNSDTKPVFAPKKEQTSGNLGGIFTSMGSQKAQGSAEKTDKSEKTDKAPQASNKPETKPGGGTLFGSKDVQSSAQVKDKIFDSMASEASGAKDKQETTKPVATSLFDSNVSGSQTGKDKKDQKTENKSFLEIQNTKPEQKTQIEEKKEDKSSLGIFGGSKGGLDFSNKLEKRSDPEDNDEPMSPPKMSSQKSKIESNDSKMIPQKSSEQNNASTSNNLFSGISNAPKKEPESKLDQNKTQPSKDDDKKPSWLSQPIGQNAPTGGLFSSTPLSTGLPGTSAPSTNLFAASNSLNQNKEPENKPEEKKTNGLEFSFGNNTNKPEEKKGNPTSLVSQTPKSNLQQVQNQPKNESTAPTGGLFGPSSNSTGLQGGLFGPTSQQPSNQGATGGLNLSTQNMAGLFNGPAQTQQTSTSNTGFGQTGNLSALGKSTMGSTGFGAPTTGPINFGGVLNQQASTSGGGSNLFMSGNTQQNNSWLSNIGNAANQPPQPTQQSSGGGGLFGSIRT